MQVHARRLEQHKLALLYSRSSGWRAIDLVKLSSSAKDTLLDRVYARVSGLGYYLEDYKV